MNKKVLSAILFSALFAGTGTFTSCIDNDEPTGIEELRGAKAELIRAKVAVEQANAAFKLAQAEVEKAEAAIKNAMAEKEKALAEKAKLEAELQAITNEEAKFNLEQRIAEAELAAEEAKLEHEKAMLELKQELAKAQREYELALAQIAIAKAIASEADKVKVSELELAVSEAQADVDKALADVETAEENYYNATLDAKKNEVSMKRLETAVAAEEAKLAAAQETYTAWENFLNEDAATNDWAAEIAALEDSVKGLEKRQVELGVELVKLQNSEEYKALIDAFESAKKTYQEQKTGSRLSTKDVLGTVKTIDKGIGIKKAIVAIGGANCDGAGGYIAEYNEKIAGYTSQVKAVLDLIAKDYDNQVKKAKEASDEAIEAWQKATTAYETAKAYTTEQKDKKTLADAYSAYTKAMNDAGTLTDATEKAKAEVKAQQAFADAIVKYYDAAAPVQLTCNTVTLGITTTVSGTTKTTWTTKSVKEWLSDASNKDAYLSALITYFNGDATKLWAVGEKETVTAGEEPTAKAEGALATLKTVSDILKELKNASNDAFGTALLYETGHALEEDYMRVVPTEAEVKAVAGYESNCGTLGYYYWITRPEMKLEADYKTIIANYEEIIAYWTEQMNALIAADSEAYSSYVEAYNAKTDYEVTNFTAINTEIAYEIQGRINAINRIKAALVKALNAYLPEGGEDYSDTEGFKTWLEEQKAEALEAVFDAEEALIDAQNGLQKALDGKLDPFSNLAEAEEGLAEAMAKLKAAQAELETALANLAKGLEILAATNAN